MQTVILDRRAFLIGACSFTAGFIASGRLAVADELTDWLIRPVVAGTGVIDSKKIGALSEESLQQFTRFGVFLVSRWGLGAHVELDDSEIRELFEIKSNAEPSYYSEYRMAEETIARAQSSLASEEKAFDMLAFGTVSDPLAQFSRLGRFRKFVFAELARFLIAAGGFRRFKPADGNPPAKNYQGYMAGPFNDPNHLPYRGLDT